MSHIPNAEVIIGVNGSETYVSYTQKINGENVKKSTSDVTVVAAAKNFIEAVYDFEGENYVDAVNELTNRG